MKKIILFMLSVMTLASCSKNADPTPAQASPTPTTTTSSPIVGDWTLQSGVQVVTFRDGSTDSFVITATKKAHFDENGTATDALDPFNSGRTMIPYAYNATTSKLVFGEGAIPYVFDVLALTKNNFWLRITTPPSTGDGTFSTYNYHYTK